MIRCSVCGESRERDAFYKRRDRPKGVMSRCKVCTRTAVKAYQSVPKNRERDYARKRVYRSDPHHKALARARTQLWNATNPERAKQHSKNRPRVKGKAKVTATSRNNARWGHLEDRYEVTQDNFGALLESQGGVCAICKHSETVLGRGGKVRPLSVDHDHATGRVRGLLCDACNNGIARFNDAPERLLAAATYLGWASLTTSP